MAYLIGLLVTPFVLLIIGGLIYWGVQRLAGTFGIPGPIIVIVEVFLVVILVVILLGLLLGSIHPLTLPTR